MTVLTTEQRTELQRLGFMEGRQASWYLCGADGAPGSFLWPYKHRWHAAPATYRWDDDFPLFDDPVVAAIRIKLEIGQ